MAIRGETAAITIQEIILDIQLLSDTDYALLLDFIENTANWMMNDFDFTDEKGRDYDGCFFLFTRVDFREAFLNRLADTLRMEGTFVP